MGWKCHGPTDRWTRRFLEWSRIVENFFSHLWQQFFVRLVQHCENFDTPPPPPVQEISLTWKYFNLLKIQNQVKRGFCAKWECGGLKSPNSCTQKRSNNLLSKNPKEEEEQFTMAIKFNGNAGVVINVTSLNDSLKQTPCLGQVYSLD